MKHSTRIMPLVAVALAALVAPVAASSKAPRERCAEEGSRTLLRTSHARLFRRDAKLGGPVVGCLYSSGRKLRLNDKPRQMTVGSSASAPFALAGRYALARIGFPSEDETDELITVFDISHAEPASAGMAEEVASALVTGRALRAILTTRGEFAWSASIRGGYEIHVAAPSGRPVTTVASGPGVDPRSLRRCGSRRRRACWTEGDRKRSTSMARPSAASAAAAWVDRLPGCRTPAGRGDDDWYVVKRTKEITLWEGPWGGVVCRKDTGRAFSVGEDIAGGRVERKWVAAEFWNEGGDYGGCGLLVADSVRRRVGVLAYYSTVDGSPGQPGGTDPEYGDGDCIRRYIVHRWGAVAWTVKDKVFACRSRCTVPGEDEQYSRRERAVVLARGADIRESTLRKTRDGVTWVQAGRRRSARLRP